jgi:hypothetical protein
VILRRRSKDKQCLFVCFSVRPSVLRSVCWLVGWLLCFLGWLDGSHFMLLMDFMPDEKLFMNI